MLYPMVCTHAFETAVPYVLAIHDLQHRLQPEFPEVSADGEYERREYLFGNAARYATLVLADSEVGKEDILAAYGDSGITADRVKVLPFLPACAPRPRLSGAQREALRARYGLPPRYLFCPAHFWPHKNHARIIEALAWVRRQHGEEIPIVLTGSHTGALREFTWTALRERMHAQGVGGQVHALGYVPDEDVAALYASAEALVFPTFFGPTNIPILEAWACDCPVLTSDLRGIREQVGPAGLLVDPRSVEALAEGIHRLWNDATLRQQLVESGRARLAAYTHEDYLARLTEILAEARERARVEGPRRKRPGDPTEDDHDRQPCRTHV
jgi:glycosyltransferase involved in cell wall biosynthesis